LEGASGGDDAAHAAVVAELDELIVEAGGTPPAGVDDFGKLCKMLADLIASKPDPKGASQDVIKKLGQAINDANDPSPGTCTIYLTTPPTVIPTNKEQCALIYGGTFQAT
jgi:hypothetical protein